MAQLEWADACKRVQADDGLPYRDLGSWSEDKLFVWHKYIQITTSAMVGSPLWRSGLTYVDLFAGPGAGIIKKSTRRIPGSPLIASFAPKPFEKIFLVEKDPALATACESRVAAAGAGNRAQVLRGDCNILVDQIVKGIPRGALTLAFIDPEGLDARWDTVAKLASAGRVDILMLFADAYDAVRNIESFISGEDDRLDKVLGPHSTWRDDVKKLPDWQGAKLRPWLADEYVRLLKKHLGYKAASTKVIEGPHGPLYRLIYASKHEKGLDFWQKVDHKDRHGTAGLFGP